MKKSIIWQCNYCGKEVDDRDETPMHWFHVTIVGENIALIADYCSRDCLEKGLEEEIVRDKI